MTHISLRRALLVVAAIACAAGSLDWSSDGISFSLVARKRGWGRPLTPVSVAGVARRTTRRAVVGGAAVGAAARRLRACAGEWKVRLPLVKESAAYTTTLSSMIVGAIAQISRCRQVPRAEEFRMAEITRLFAAQGAR